MTEESKDNKDPEDLSDSEDFSLEENDTDWGDAWESAFEAEEEADDSSEDATEDFYLEDAEEVDDSSTTVIKSPDSDSQPTPPSGSNSAAIATSSTSSGLVISLRIPPFFTKLATWITYLKERYQSLQPKQKIILGGGAALLFLAVAILIALSPEETTLIPQEQLNQPEELIANSSASVPTPPMDAIKKPDLEIIDMPEKVRKKWTFPSFFIPVSSQEADKTITFVVIDITLLLLLDEGEEIPEAKKAFVRDIIYQFYINRPLYELRRFSLARGDMNRALRAWLEKQWPEGAIEAISFKRYLLT